MIDQILLDLIALQGAITHLKTIPEKDRPWDIIRTLEQILAREWAQYERRVEFELGCG